jgi:hypothetical protein
MAEQDDLLRAHMEYLDGRRAELLEEYRSQAAE